MLWEVRERESKRENEGGREKEREKIWEDVLKEKGLELKLTHTERVEGNWEERASLS